MPPTPNAPTITSVNDPFWDVTTPNWADLQINFFFTHGTFPVAQIEMWVSKNLAPYVLLGTVASTANNFYYANACDLNGADFNFKARYKNGATLGPYSNVFHFVVTAI